MIRVLIVDDQEDIRTLVRVVITAANRDLLVGGEAATGEEALAVLDDVDPTVIVLDQMMPGLSGIETAARIIERRPGQRIVLFSAYLDRDLRDRAEEAGIWCCLAKEDVSSIPETLRAAA